MLSWSSATFSKLRNWLFTVLGYHSKIAMISEVCSSRYCKWCIDDYWVRRLYASLNCLLLARVLPILLPFLRWNQASVETERYHWTFDGSSSVWNLWFCHFQLRFVLGSAGTLYRQRIVFKRNSVWFCAYCSLILIFRFPSMLLYSHICIPTFVHTTIAWRTLIYFINAHA